MKHIPYWQEEYSLTNDQTALVQLYAWKFNIGILRAIELLKDKAENAGCNLSDILDFMIQSNRF